MNDTHEERIEADGTHSQIGVRFMRWLAVALTLFTLPGCSDATESFVSTKAPIIYGTDDRREAYEQSLGSVGEQVAAGTVALIDVSRIDSTDPSGVKLDATTLGARLNLCSNERFRDEPSAAFCSGTLIAPDLVLTAGHCVDSTNCGSTRIVLGYRMQTASMLAPITTEQVYSCSEVLVQRFASDVDYAILRLERPTRGVELAPVKVGALPMTKGADLVVAGYPSGLPLKIAGGATVLDARPKVVDFFMADLDAFPGNSGGGVYDAKSGELAGILVRGPNPGYVRLSGETCYRAEQGDASTGTLIESVYVHHAIDALCSVTTDARLCACGDGTCDVSARESTATCPADCGSKCGDTACNGTEDGNNCYSDCGSCGDGLCHNTELLQMNCVQDCGCPPGLVPRGTNCMPALGNVNGDERIDSADVAELTLSLTHRGSESLGRESADVDCNGSVDQADLRALERFVSGKTSKLPCDVVTGLALGGQHSCALMQTGQVRCWGDNTYGQLGIGSTETIGDNEGAWSAPLVGLVGPVAAVAAGSSHNCALLVDGTVECWGDGTEGVLGYGDTDNVGDDELPKQKGIVSLGATASSVAVGGTHSCAILEGGAVRCWGSNDFGQLGTGFERAIGDDELPSSVPTIVFDSPVAQLALGFDFTCALLMSGNVHCWGENFVGQLGRGEASGSDPFESAQSSPAVQIGGPATRIVAGLMNACALRADGQVFCWGDNSSGQLGYGTFDPVGDDERPVDMGPLVFGSEVAEIAIGDSHACSRHADGTIRCWGNNEHGELGYGDPSLTAPPLALADVSAVPVGALVQSVFVGGRHSCALLTDGNIRCWGSNSRGQL